MEGLTPGYDSPIYKKGYHKMSTAEKSLAEYLMCFDGRGFSITAKQIVEWIEDLEKEDVPETLFSANGEAYKVELKLIDGKHVYVVAPKRVKEVLNAAVV